MQLCFVQTFSSSYPSASSSLYSATVAHPCSDLSAILIIFCLSLINYSPSLSASLAFSMAGFMMIWQLALHLYYLALHVVHSWHEHELVKLGLGNRSHARTSDGRTAFSWYGGREGPFQTSNFSISISELVISKLTFLKLSFQNLYLNLYFSQQLDYCV